MAIVGRILLAFAIDALCTERLERVDEVAQLKRLHSEFVNKIKRIDTKTIEKRIQEQNILFYEFIHESLKKIEVPAKMIRAITTAATFDDDTPILNGLINSGCLEIIQNIEVLSLISTWDRTFYDYKKITEQSKKM